MTVNCYKKCGQLFHDVEQRDAHIQKKHTITLIVSKVADDLFYGRPFQCTRQLNTNKANLNTYVKCANKALWKNTNSKEANECSQQ